MPLISGWVANFTHKIPALFPTDSKIPALFKPLCTLYMRRWTGSALVQVMACHLFGAKPLPAGLLSSGLLGTNFNEIRIGILSFSFKKMHSKLSSDKVAAILFRGRWVNSLWPGNAYRHKHTCLRWNKNETWMKSETVLSRKCKKFVKIVCKMPTNISRYHSSSTSTIVYLWIYRKISNIRRTKSPNLNVPRLILQLSLSNPMKLGARLRMKM